MDAIIRMLRPGPDSARTQRRRPHPDPDGLVAVHPDALWGQVCITPGPEFLITPHANSNQTWLFYPDRATSPRRGIMLEIHFGAAHTGAGADGIDLAESLTRTMQRPLPGSRIHINEIPLQIAGIGTDVEYLEWEDEPLEQLRFTRHGRRITLAGWQSVKPLPALAEDDLRLLNPALFDAFCSPD